MCAIRNNARAQTLCCRVIVARRAALRWGLPRSDAASVVELLTRSQGPGWPGDSFLGFVRTATSHTGKSIVLVAMLYLDISEQTKLKIQGNK